jgi:predicted nucleic acid-binding protein
VSGVVVDASIAVKWYTDHPDSSDAIAVLASSGCYAPSLIYLEVGNALRRYVQNGDLPASDALLALNELSKCLETTEPGPKFARQTLQLSLGLRHCVYDCSYLALSRHLGMPLVTADKRLAALCADASVDVQML